MKINQQKTVQVDIKVLKLHVKTVDSNNLTLVDSEGEVVAEREEANVPGFFPGQHHGDYVIFDIDIETGKILNWKPPTAEQLEDFINGE